MLKILILGGITSDARLIQKQLQNLDYAVEYKITAKEKEYSRLLYSFNPDLVISDYTLPEYDGLKALRLLREKDEHTPFIFVTGTPEEEYTIKAIKHGASDFLIRENLSQLPVAVLKVLREREEVRKKQGFERQLVAINALNAALLEHEHWEDALNEAFGVIGRSLRADRVYYFENHIDTDTGQELTSQKLEWAKDNVNPQIDNPELQNLSFEAIAELIEPLKNNKPFKAKVAELPNTSFRKMLTEQDIRSILVLPVFVKKDFYGFIGFDECTYDREWSEDEYEFLASLTSSLSSGIEKRDILKHLKKSESKLRKTNERLRTAQHIAKLGYWSWNLDTNQSEWTEETYRIYGYTPDNFVPTLENVRATFHPEDRYLLDLDPQTTFATGGEHSVDQRIITADGEVRWVNFRINLRRDKDGKPSMFEGTVQDITEQKEQQEQLKTSKERFELAMKASSELIWDWDHTSGEIFRSFSYETSFGYKIREQVWKENSWFSKVHPEDIEELWYHLNQCLEDKNVHQWEQEYRVIKPNDEVAFVIDRAYIVRNESGAPVRSVGALLDVTESREQYEKIKNQNEVLREIAWLQSHVIRAPLARIMGLINLSREYGNVEISDTEINDMIMESAEELDEVVREITLKTESAKSRSHYE